VLDLSNEELVNKHYFEKDRQHNGQTKKTDNTMVKRKRQTTQWPNEKRENDKLQSITHKTKNRGNNRKCWQICFFLFIFLLK
jgi:hypothetical protein